MDRSSNLARRNNLFLSLVIKLFLLDCWRGQNKRKPIIVISGKSYDRFLELVKPDIIPSMVGKLPSSRVK